MSPLCNELPNVPVDGLEDRSSSSEPYKMQLHPTTNNLDGDYKNMQGKGCELKCLSKKNPYLLTNKQALGDVCENVATP